MSNRRQLSRVQRSRKHRAEAKRVLKKGVSRPSSVFDGQNCLQFQLLNIFGRAHRLHDAIDDAFSHEPFIPGVAPTEPINFRRFKLMIDLHMDVSNLMGRAMELWFLAAGLKKEDNWVPLSVERYRQETKLRIAELSEKASTKERL